MNNVVHSAVVLHNKFNKTHIFLIVPRLNNIWAWFFSFCMCVCLFVWMLCVSFLFTIMCAMTMCARVNYFVMLNFHFILFVGLYIYWFIMVKTITHIILEPVTYTIFKLMNLAEFSTTHFYAVNLNNITKTIVISTNNNHLHWTIFPFSVCREFFLANFVWIGFWFIVWFDVIYRLNSIIILYLNVCVNESQSNVIVVFLTSNQ